MERSLVLVKPDGVQRGLVGEVIARLERRGLRLAGAKFMRVSRALAEEHYAIHKGKPFYDGLIAYILSAPVMAMVWEGPGAVALIRQTMGATRPGRPPRAASATTSRWRWAATSRTPPTARKTVKRKPRCGSSRGNWSPGAATWISGSSRSKEQ